MSIFRRKTPDSILGLDGQNRADPSGRVVPDRVRVDRNPAVEFSREVALNRLTKKATEFGVSLNRQEASELLSSYKNKPDTHGVPGVEYSMGGNSYRFSLRLDGKVFEVINGNLNTSDNFEDGQKQYDKMVPIFSFLGDLIEGQHAASEVSGNMTLEQRNAISESLGLRAESVNQNAQETIDQAEEEQIGFLRRSMKKVKTTAAWRWGTAFTKWDEKMTEKMRSAGAAGLKEALGLAKSAAGYIHERGINDALNVYISSPIEDLGSILPGLTGQENRLLRTLATAEQHNLVAQKMKMIEDGLAGDSSEVQSIDQASSELLGRYVQEMDESQNRARQANQRMAGRINTAKAGLKQIFTATGRGWKEASAAQSAEENPQPTEASTPPSPEDTARATAAAEAQRQSEATRALFELLES